ncbi:MAG: efflux RND transporter periplasmic adaptor subunit [Tannerella sp.]|jgi:multidrug resistance efflux pump|nr:efflux RND transporter periplasmic adaptor subunit [Tannerella sp.]
MNHPKEILKFGLFFLLAVLLFTCKDKNANQIPTSKAVKGVFYVDLYEEGEIEAVNAINISSPSINYRFGYNMKITYIVKDGTEVNAGDTLLIFDPSDVNKAIMDAQSKLEINDAELEKMIAQQESDLEELRANYEVTRISHEISKIRLEQAGYESDIKKKEIELNLEKAEIALQQAKEQIDNRIKINTEEVKQRKLSISQDQQLLNDANAALRQLTVVTPSPGIAIISHNWSTGNKFQVGEQVWTGMPLISLPDLSQLKATVRINEVDIAKISKGLNVEIKPDAFSESKFTGVVKEIANLAENKQGSTKIKVFPVSIYLNETDKNLLPGLTVSCRIIVDKLEDVLYVPIDAIYTELGVNFVYKKSGTGFKKMEVETGNSNSDYAVIVKGLDEGDEVALTDPFYEENKEKEKETTANAQKN